MDQVIFKDGLGERRRSTNVSQTDRFDVLHLDGALTSAPTFEAALRARVTRLATFHHPQFAAIRGVEPSSELPAFTLAIAYDAAPGIRLSELVGTGHKSTLAFDIGIALFLIRQLVAGVAALHEEGEDLSHGAIALERLVLTPDARLVIVEHMLGPALEELQLSHKRLWEELRVASVRATTPPKLDQRADTFQLGIVSLSMILGRPLTADEYPTRLPELVATAWAVSAKGNLEPVPAGLRAWLGRALQLDARSSFASAIEARAELHKMFGADAALSTPPALKAFFGNEQPTAPAAGAAALSSPRMASEVLAPVHVPEPTKADELRAIRAADLAPATALDPPAYQSVPLAVFETQRPPAENTSRFLADEPSEPRVDDMALTAATLDQMPPISHQETIPMVARIPVQRTTKWGVALAACIVLVLASGGVPAARRYFKPTVASVAPGRLTITTNPDGASVLVDGEAKGVTPIQLTVVPGPHVVELRGQGEPRRLSVTVDAGAVVSQYLELPKSTASLGGLVVKSDPPGARVTVDGIAQGTSPVSISGLVPGEHIVLIEGEAGSTKQTVVVEPGVTGALTTQLSNQSAPASGWISVSAPAEVQLFENGRLVGSSQTDRVMVLAGTHQLELVNQALGYKVNRSVQVAAGTTSNLKLEFPNGTMALNATPWADVWIDGVRIGETPIGNLAVAIGSHEVVFKHPDFGEQKHAATVTLNAPTRLSVDMRKK